VKPLLACAAASLGMVLTACGTQTEDALAPLQLTDAGAPAQIAAAAPGGDANGFELHATLPSAAPADAPVWRLPHASSADAPQVADALGIPGRPTAVDGGWVTRYGAQRLAVRRDGSWSYGLDCSPNLPLRQENLDVMCATASGGGVAVAPGSTPTPPIAPTIPPGPTAATARTLAAPILQRLGWGAATLEVSVGSPTTSVTARMNVGDTETADWLTSLTFDAGDLLAGGNGWVGTPTRGRSYPLIDAARAYSMLKAEPRMAPEICQVRKDGKPGCEPIPPTVITGVRLGLALRHDLERPLLVPAWLFETQGGGTPIAVVAVDPRWLKPPATTVPLQRSPQTVPASPVPANSAGPATKPS